MALHYSIKTTKDYKVYLPTVVDLISDGRS